MDIGDILTFKKFIDEMLQWLDELREMSVPNKPWFDMKTNKPRMVGLFLKVEKFHDGNWRLINSGVYEKYKKINTKSKYTTHTFKFPGIDWTDEELTAEVSRQYKEFCIKNKLNELEQDFV